MVSNPQFLSSHLKHRNMSMFHVYRRWIFKCSIDWHVKPFHIYHIFNIPACNDISSLYINTLRPRQNGCHFADDKFKCIFLNENVWIPIEISLKFVPKGSINNNPALFQIMAWRRPGDKPLSEPMMVSSLTHICVTRHQWVNFTSSKLHML